MNISEQEFKDEMMDKLQELAIEAITPLAKELNVSLCEWIDTYLYDWQQNGNPPSLFIHQDNLIPAISAVWASVLQEQYNWEWVVLTFHEHDNWQGLAIVSPDRSLMVLPFAYVNECLSGTDEVKISASIVALENNIIPPQEPKSYTNIMQGLQRIVPRG